MLTAVRRRAGLVLAATLLGVVVTANLGAWQLRRAAQKIALQDALASQAALPAVAQADLAASTDAADLQHYRGVRLRGRWLPERTVFLENRQMHARVGFYVVTPLQLERPPGSAPNGPATTVLVQRGWVPRDANNRTLLPVLTTPTEPVEIDGRIAPPPARLYELGHEAGGTIRQNLDLAGFAAETGLPLAPLSVQQVDSPSTTGDGLLRDWPLPAVDVQKHYGYAFQWFALGALMTGLYVWFQLVRPRLRPAA